MNYFNFDLILIILNKNYNILIDFYMFFMEKIDKERLYHNEIYEDFVLIKKIARQQLNYCKKCNCSMADYNTILRIE